jgi:hypothetical protein
VMNGHQGLSLLGVKVRPELAGGEEL